MNEFEKELNQKAEEVFQIINRFMPEEDGMQSRVMQSMNYSFSAGGKRLRPLMMLESYRLFGGNDVEKIAPFMAAIEMIHTYSLIHDDLPAMDNDDYRRGKLTNHKMFDEATAILAGDGLLNFAFETVANAMDKEEDFETLKRMVKAEKVLSKKAGVYGMIGGQMVDLSMEHKKDVDLDTILFIHKCKTAALIEASLMIGAIMAGANKEEVLEVEKAGFNLGLAFQIQDDILDVTGDSEVLGKSVGSDDKNEKSTFVTIKGLEEAQNEQKRLSDEAVNTIMQIGKEETFLARLIKYLVTRNY